MCSVQDDEEQQERMRTGGSTSLLSEPSSVAGATGAADRAEGATASHRRICVRCDAIACVNAREKEVYCRPCFLRFMVERLKGSVRKVEPFPEKSDKALIACSGGLHSSVLAHLMSNLLKPKQHQFNKTGLFSAGAALFHIDESVLAHAHVETGVYLASNNPLAGIELTPAQNAAVNQATEKVYLTSIHEMQSSVQSTLSAIAKASGDWPLVTARLEDAFDPALSSSHEFAAYLHLAQGAAQQDLPASQASMAAARSADAKVLPQPPLSRAGQSERNKELLLAAFAGLSSASAREDLLFVLRRRLLVHHARAGGYKWVYLGDCANRIAQNMISLMARGRGASLAAETGAVDTSLKDVYFVRPLRGLLSKELCIFARYSNIDSVEMPTLVSGAKIVRLWKEKDIQSCKGSLPATSHEDGPCVEVPAWKQLFRNANSEAQQSQALPHLASSIEALTEQFVSGLQSEFPSTINTVQRTSEKLDRGARDDGTGSAIERCTICLVSLTPKEQPLTRTRLEFQPSHSSQPVSGASDGRCESRDCQCESGGKTPSPAAGSSDGSCCSSKSSTGVAGSLQGFLSTVCYACRLTLRDSNSNGTVLPPFVAESSLRLLARSRMREEISEFLLDADEEGDDDDDDAKG